MGREEPKRTGVVRGPGPFKFDVTRKILRTGCFGLVWMLGKVKGKPQENVEFSSNYYCF